MTYSKYTFRLPEEAYVPSAEHALKVASLRDLSREYVRLRGIAVKSGQRLQEAGYRPGEAFSFPTLTELKAGDAVADPSMLSRELTRLATYIASPTRTVSGRKKAHKAKIINSLHESGFDFVDNSNIDEFGDFMDYLRDNYTKRMISSDEVAMLFELSEKAGILPSELKSKFEEYSDNLREAERILFEWDESSPLSAAEVRKRMGIE